MSRKEINMYCLNCAAVEGADKTVRAHKHIKKFKNDYKIRSPSKMENGRDEADNCAK